MVQGQAVYTVGLQEMGLAQISIKAGSSLLRGDTGIH